MENIIIKETRSAPKVIFNYEKSLLKLKGQSYPENAFKFYEIVFHTMDDFFEYGGEALRVEFYLTYLNTSSTKCIMDIIYKLEQAAVNGKHITINWYYNSKNRSIYECGIEFKEDINENVIFNLIEEE